jgi:hypothetical protein
VPVLVVVVLLAALVFRLSSCSSDAAKGAPSAENPASPSAIAAPASSTTSGDNDKANPKPPYNGAEIKSIYENLGLAVIEIRDDGDVTMVHYYKPTGVPGEIISRFDWFDRTTGARDFVFGGAFTEAFDIKGDKSFTALTGGLSDSEGIPAFPKIYRAAYSDIDGAARFTGGSEKYYAPLENSYVIGSDRRAILTDVNVTPGFISLGFGPQPGYERAFYSDFVSIPKMEISAADGIVTLTLYKTLLAKDAENLSVKENPYCSIVSMRAVGDTFMIELQLNESVSRYNVSTDYSPATGLPYAVIEMTNMVYDYPAGW